MRDSLFIQERISGINVVSSVSDGEIWPTFLEIWGKNRQIHCEKYHFFLSCDPYFSINAEAFPTVFAAKHYTPWSSLHIHVYTEITLFMSHYEGKIIEILTILTKFCDPWISVTHSNNRKSHRSRNRPKKCALHRGGPHCLRQKFQEIILKESIFWI